MRIENGLVAIFYTYPPMLYAVRLLCPLVFRGNIEDAESKRKTNLVKGIWYLQWLLSLLIVCTFGSIYDSKRVAKLTLHEACDQWFCCCRVYIRYPNRSRSQNERGIPCTFLGM